MTGRWAARWPRVAAGDGEAARVEKLIDEELHLHLNLLDRDLRESGLDQEAAHRESRRRFGDIDAVRRECRRLALGERIMLQRINCVLLVLVVALLGFGLYWLMATEASRARSLAVIAARLNGAGGERMPLPPSAATPSDGSTYSVEGPVAHPGTYDMPAGMRITLRRALAAAGGVPRGSRSAAVVSSGGSVRLQIGADELNDPAGRDIELQPLDVIRVR